MRRMMRAAAAAVLSVALVAPALAAPAANTGSAPWYAVGRAIFAEAVNIRTAVGNNGTPELAEKLAARFRAAGFPDQDIHVVRHKDTAALVVRYRGDGSSGKKPILAIAHMDVVDALASDWSRDPFEFAEIDGYFYGRGTSDDKIGVVALATAFLRMKAEGYVPTRDLILEFSGDEETTGETTALLAREHRDLIDAEYALNADAGGGAFNEQGQILPFGLQTSEKIYASFTLTTRNRGGHSSGPRRDNAIYQLAQALLKVQDARFPSHINDTTRLSLVADMKDRPAGDPIAEAARRFIANPADEAAADVLEASEEYVGSTRTTCVATLLQGGHGENALPQSAQATVNCRIFPGESIATVQGILAAAIGDPGVEVKPIGTIWEAEGSPLRQDVMDAYTRALRRNHPGVTVVPSMSLGASDGIILRHFGIPTYGVDGSWAVVPIDDRAHGQDERLPVKAFEDDVDHWYWMLTDLGGKGRKRR
ncbi:MAG: M20/M25/M40 family metallo-hydrolase [Caulobacteraceae bacterium]|nr:M20/M25/M40 family metallo-hydrolase [Caulobacteraceae bacterium]